MYVCVYVYNYRAEGKPILEPIEYKKFKMILIESLIKIFSVSYKVCILFFAAFFLLILNTSSKLSMMVRQIH